MSQTIEEIQVEKKTAFKFRRDATKFLLYLFFIFIFVGIWFLVQSNETLGRIEEQDRLFIEKIKKQLNERKMKRGLNNPV